MLPNQNELNDYALQGYNHIPVFREVLADFETPLNVFCKLANQACGYLFESVQGGEKSERYSVIGLPCTQRLEIRGHQLRYYQADTLITEKHADDPLGEIEHFREKFKVPDVDDLPRFSGSLVGYFGFDTIQLIEPKPELEWIETMNKGRAIFKTAALAESGLDLSLDERGHR